jgi:hypothetical protein
LTHLSRDVGPDVNWRVRDLIKKLGPAVDQCDDVAEESNIDSCLERFTLLQRKKSRLNGSRGCNAPGHNHQIAAIRA